MSGPSARNQSAHTAAALLGTSRRPGRASESHTSANSAEGPQCIDARIVRASWHSVDPYRWHLVSSVSWQFQFQFRRCLDFSAGALERPCSSFPGGPGTPDLPPSGLGSRSHLLFSSALTLRPRRLRRRRLRAPRPPAWRHRRPPRTRATRPCPDACALR